MSEQDEETRKAGNDARARAIALKVESKAPKDICPYCNNTIWWVLQEEGKSIALITAELKGFDTYTLACTNCGLLRQHLAQIIDGEITGEVKYAQPKE